MMEITCYPVAFGRWKAEFWIDGELYTEAIGPRPGCVVRDVMNYFCLKMDGMPNKEVKLTFTEWE